jgi:hypothetical protein
MISAWECFHSATLELVRSTPIKQRLVAAYRRYLAALEEEDLPGDVRESFGQMTRCLRGVQPLPGEDAVAASVRKMSTQQADECAASIVEMFGSVCRAKFAPDRPNTVVQLHSVDCGPAEFETPAPLAAAAN